MQLLTPSLVLPETNSCNEICKGDVEEVHALLHDAKFSTKLLAEQADEYVS